MNGPNGTTCPGCGNALGGDNLCMVSACEMEGVAPYWCDRHCCLLSRCHAFGRTHVVPREVQAVSPDCDQRKCTACTGDAWDLTGDRPAHCTCTCHDTAHSDREVVMTGVTLVGTTNDRLPCGCIPYEHRQYGPCAGPLASNESS